MPNWPGGPCPSCGEDMPENLIHCMTCRALLNPELEPDSVEVPSFFELQEISCMIEMKSRGVYVNCPHCSRELRVNKKYAGETVSCNHCNGKFDLKLESEKTAPTAYYGDCPHCQKELRIGKRYVGTKVACKFCQGKIEILA